MIEGQYAEAFEGNPVLAFTQEHAHDNLPFKRRVLVLRLGFWHDERHGVVGLLGGRRDRILVGPARALRHVVGTQRPNAAASRDDRKVFPVLERPEVFVRVFSTGATQLAQLDGTRVGRFPC